ncbi:MAG: tetratricopeptide repeat protein [Pleurocapsa sp.]
MSFAINYGLFKLKITDYHAILGVSLDADGKEIRQRYLKIAQKLHPDICKGDVTQKKAASDILSKLVNPAYEQLSRKNTFAEHQLILTQMGKVLVKKKDKIAVHSSSAQELLKSGDKFELMYPKLLAKLGGEQYKSLTNITDKIAAISELNLVYLMLKSERGLNREDIVAKAPAAKPPVPPPPKPKTEAKPEAKAQKVEPAEATPQSRAESYIRRAKQYIDKKDFAQAVIELKDALRLDPNSSIGHALMGKAYLQQNQLTMAKVHINKAYRANPKEPLVIECKKELDKLTQKQNKEQKSNKSKEDDKSSNSGFFSGIFGAKKK